MSNTDQRGILAHAQRVLSTVSGDSALPDGTTKLDRMVFRSWSRCVEKYNISPEGAYQPVILEQQILREHQDRFSLVQDVAGDSVCKLFSFLVGTGYSVLFTDANGVTLDCRYDPGCDRELRKLGLWTGAVWAEQIAGTNGIGTSLVERRPTIVKKHHHFFSNNTNMSCTVSPVFDGRGKIIATLDATTLRPETENENTLVRRLVQQYAKQIEHLYFSREFRDNWLFRFSTSKNTSDDTTTGILAINAEGRVIGATKNAIDLLDTEVDDRKIITSVFARYDLIDFSFDEVFDCTFAELVDRHRRITSGYNSIRTLDGRTNYFCALSPPFSSPVSKTPFTKRNTSRRRGAKKIHPDLGSLAGNDAQMRNVERTLEQIIDLDLNILIVGETGTGKEALAKAIHDASERKSKPFIAINCAAIPESLIESELFGYATGTFTGALKKGMKGKLIQANGGTLFLDEIGDMPLDLQTRLLRVLSEMEVNPLGEAEPVALDIQVIAATNKKIGPLIDGSNFREDLYFRLNGATVELPALRSRTDKRELIESIFDSNAGSNGCDISDQAMEVLMNYAWPGNIRQLINVAKYANAMSAGTQILPEHFPPELNAEVPTTTQQSIIESEYTTLINSLSANKWNITKVSKQLDICRATVYRKMKKYNIVPPNHS